MKLHIPLASVLLLGSIISNSAHADTPLLVAGTPVTVPGGSAKFDFMAFDDDNHRIFASHPGKGTLVVYDTQAGTVQQLDTDGEVNGEAIDRVDSKLFVGGGNQKVLVFDLATLKKTDEISLTGPADCLTFDAKNDTLYADHDDGKEIWTINGSTDKIGSSVAIADAPEVLVYNKKADKLYQNIKPANEIQVIDPATNAVTATWPTAPLTSPHGLAVDSKAQHLFVAGDGKVDLIDMATGKVLSTVNIASGYVDQIAFDKSSKRLYCASKIGDISVVQETDDTIALLGMVQVAVGTHTLAVDTVTHTVWAATFDDKGSYLQPFTMP